MTAIPKAKCHLRQSAPDSCSGKIVDCHGRESDKCADKTEIQSEEHSFGEVLHEGGDVTELVHMAKVTCPCVVDSETDGTANHSDIE